jgi:glucans biosynthesis protein C
MEQKQQTRLHYIDNLRAIIIILVVIGHAAATYSGLGMWYYIENKVSDIGSIVFFASFLAITQSFDMSFLFMLAGYFTPHSFDVKGPARFIKNRLFRLGLPLLIYILIIHPLAVKLAYPNVNIIDFFINGLKSLSIFGWSGPLWFVEVLLIFTVIYAILRILLRKKMSFVPPKINFINISLLTLIITIIAFLIRIVMPIGTAFMNLQFPFFSGYIVMFIIGIISKRLELFDNIDSRTGKKWLITFSICYACFTLLIIFGVPMIGGARIVIGGFTWQSFAYALWESFSCVTISIGLIGIFRSRFNRQNRLQKLLSENYFGVYVFHAPILIAISVSIKWLVIHPLIKFILAAACAITVSYLFTFLVRKIHFMKIFFS